MLADGRLTWRDGPTESLDLDVLRPVDDPFDKDGGLRMLAGNLGRAVIKTSAVVPEHRLVEAPARVFGDQSEFQAAFEAGRAGPTTSSPSSATRARRPTACRSCTS